MSAPGSVIEAQLQALLKLVTDHRDRRCTEMLDQARSQAASIVRQAHAGARGRTHQAVDEERRRVRERVEAARAQLQTRQRQAQQQAAQLLLRSCWEMLQENLHARWRNPATRRRWLEALVGIGRERLPAQAWEVLHPPGWDPAAEPWLAERVAQATGQAPHFRPDAGIAAGIRLCADGACLDGTVQGLMADRIAMESQLLAEIDRLRMTT